MAVTIDESALFSRLAVVRRLLRPLRPANNQDVACAFDNVTIRAGARVIGAHDGSADGRSYRDWWFKTRCTHLRAQYFEFWKDDGSGLLFECRQAYLHLVKTQGHNQQQIKLVALHSDPFDSDRFKMGPHIHVEDSNHPLPDCHFPLNLSNLDEVLESAGSLTLAMQEAIEIVGKEVLVRF